MLSPDMQHRRIVDGAFAAAGAPDVMPVGGAEGDALTAGRRPGCQAGSGRANVSGYGS
jgi:hypothetical protein